MTRCVFRAHAATRSGVIGPPVPGRSVHFQENLLEWQRAGLSILLRVTFLKSRRDKAFRKLKKKEYLSGLINKIGSPE